MPDTKTHTTAESRLVFPKCWTLGGQSIFRCIYQRSPGIVGYGESTRRGGKNWGSMVPPGRYFKSRGKKCAAVESFIARWVNLIFFFDEPCETRLLNPQGRDYFWAQNKLAQGIQKAYEGLQLTMFDPSFLLLVTYILHYARKYDERVLCVYHVVFRVGGVSMLQGRKGGSLQLNPLPRMKKMHDTLKREERVQTRGVFSPRFVAIYVLQNVLQ